LFREKKKTVGTGTPIVRKRHGKGVLGGGNWTKGRVSRGKNRPGGGVCARERGGAQCPCWPMTRRNPTNTNVPHS